MSGDIFEPLQFLIIKRTIPAGKEIIVGEGSVGQVGQLGLAELLILLHQKLVRFAETNLAEITNNVPILYVFTMTG